MIRSFATLREKCHTIRLLHSTSMVGRPVSLLRENLNHARKRARAVERALRTTHDFDPIDIVRGQVGKIEKRPLDLD